MRCRSSVKDANLVLYLSVYKLFQTSDFDIIVDFRVDSKTLGTSFKYATS